MYIVIKSILDAVHMRCRLTGVSVSFLMCCLSYLGDLVKLTGSQFRQI